IGVIGVVLSVALTAVLGVLDKRGPIVDLTRSELAIRICSCISLALALGFVMLIPFNWTAFATVVGLFCVYILVLFVTDDAVNVSVGLAVILVLIIGGGIFGFTVQYRNFKYSLNGATTPRQRQKEQKQADYVQKILEEDEALKRSMQYPEKSIVLSAQAGALFQVIRIEQAYYFHYVGSIFTKADWTKCITDFENIEQYRHKKDYIIDIADIESMQAVLRTFANPYIPSFGTVKIKLRGKKKKTYVLINRMEEEELTTFFGQDIVVCNKRKEMPVRDEAEEDVPQSRRAVLNKINLARYVFSVVSFVFFTVYTFFNSEKTDPVFTALATVICLTPIVTYLVLQKYITIRDIGRFTQPDKDKINFLFTVIVFPLLFAIKCLLPGYSLVSYEYLKLVLYSLIPLAVLTVIFLVACKEYKKFKSCILMLLFAAVAFCPSFIYKANQAFDFRTPQEIVGEVTEMPTHTNDSGEVTYYLVIAYDGKTAKTEVDEKTYNQMTVGGEVTLLRYHGAFGIKTLYLK
ncbi:MAG: hypothetical protein K2M95_06720, partial [Clostridiales bacterium]|nr:hypothetical protein [Clostridiales bacterium]